MSKFGLGFTIGGSLNSSFFSATKDAKRQLGSIDEKLNALKGDHFNIKEFKRLSKDAKQNKNAINTLGRSLRNAGYDTGNLRRESRKLTVELGRLRKMKSIDLKLGNIKNKFASAKGEVLGMIAGGYTLTKVYSSAANVLKSQGEIASLNVSKQGIDRITKSGQEMALQFGQITAPQYIKAAYDIKSGIESLSESGVNNFTRMAGVTAVATKSSISEMTKLYALGYGIFRKDFSSDNNFGLQFSGAIATAVKSFRTDGSDLSQGLTNIGSSAKSMGVTLAEELAIIGVAKDTFGSASEAGTGYRAFLNGVGKSQKKLGLEFTDSYGKLLPMVNILELIKEKYGDLSLAESNQLNEAFGSTEATKFLSALIDKTDKLTAAQINLEQSMKGGLSQSEKMAKAMDKGWGLEKLSHGASYLGFTIGKVLAPAFNVAGAGLGSLASGVAWLDSNVGFLIPTIVTLAAGLGTVLVVTSAVKFSKLALSYANLSLSKSYLAVTSKIPGFSRAVLFGDVSSKKAVASKFSLAKSLKSLTSGFSIARIGSLSLSAALLANPIGAVIGAIAVGGFLIYKYWQPLGAFFGGVFDGFMGALEPVKTSLKPLFTLLSPIGDVFGLIGDGISWVIGGFGSLLSPVQLAEDELKGFATTGEKIGAIIGGAFKLALMPITLVSDAIGWVGKKLGFFNTQATDTTKTTSGFGSLHKPKSSSLLGSTLLATQLATAEPIMPPSYQSLNVPNFEQRVKQPSSIKQNISVAVTVNNPSSNVDIERAIANAMRDFGHGTTSLMDEEI